MLTQHEKDFLIYWEKNRDKEKKISRQLLFGLPLGLLISAGILLSINIPWYERADMVANTSLNPYILILAIVGITTFTAIFYKKYQWEMKEQRYRELLFKKESEKNK